MIATLKINITQRLEEANINSQQHSYKWYATITSHSSLKTESLKCSNGNNYNVWLKLQTDDKKETNDRPKHTTTIKYRRTLQRQTWHTIILIFTTT